ncbi:gliding motility lipoprotein GldD, partial [Myroides ceti]|nr:gliding motility lipoprotein GldD [Paenimyroides ceti]
TKNNLDSLLRDAQKLTYNHNIKADDIQEKIFINREAKVYGMFYKIIGNAATNVQFYATDSINHFVVGSLYFYAKPNFDSIYPATHYIETDMRHLMESIHWK